MDWLYYAIFAVLVVAGVGLNVLTLPGNWVIVLSAVVYAWATGLRHGGWWWLATLAGLALAAEVIELAAAGRAAGRLGGSRRGAFGAVVGGLLGGVFLTALIPIIFPVNAILGILAGTFLGSVAGETVAGRRVGASLAIGVAATRGRLTGTLLKIASGFVLAAVALLVGLPVW